MIISSIVETLLFDIESIITFILIKEISIERWNKEKKKTQKLRWFDLQPTCLSTRSYGDALKWCLVTRDFVSSAVDGLLSPICENLFAHLTSNHPDHYHHKEQQPEPYNVDAYPQLCSWQTPPHHFTLWSNLYD